MGAVFGELGKSLVEERDKNFPSIIFWSLGNEAGNGISEAQEHKHSLDGTLLLLNHREPRNQSLQHVCATWLSWTPTDWLWKAKPSPEILSPRGG